MRLSVVSDRAGGAHLTPAAQFPARRSGLASKTREECRNEEKIGPARSHSDLTYEREVSYKMGLPRRAVEPEIRFLEATGVGARMDPSPMEMHD